MAKKLSKVYKPVVRLQEEVTFRSVPRINMTDDMVRVKLIMTINDWRVLKRKLNFH